METNQDTTHLLQAGTVVEGDPDLHDGKNQTVHYIDYERPERNQFRAIRKFRVDRSGRSGYVLPDIVLFVNEWHPGGGRVQKPDGDGFH